MRNLLRLTIALGVAGCGASTSSVELPQLEPCARPVVIPERALNDQQVEILWSRDRRALLDCGGKVAALSGRWTE